MLDDSVEHPFDSNIEVGSYKTVNAGFWLWHI